MSKRFFKFKADKEMKDGGQRTILSFVEATTAKGAFTAAGQKAEDILGGYDNLTVTDTKPTSTNDCPGQKQLPLAEKKKE